MSNIQAIKIARLAPAPGVCPPGFVLDREAEQKLTGGFNTRRSNRCGTCFTARSANGKCSCDD